MKQARELVDADRASLFLKESDDSLYSVYADGMETIRCQIGQGIAGHVVYSGKAALVNDVYADSRFDSSMDIHSNYRTRSVMCVPLFDPDPCGCIEIINKRHGSFDQHDLEVMQKFAETIVPAIGNCIDSAAVASELNAMREELGRVKHELQVAQKGAQDGEKKSRLLRHISSLQSEHEEDICTFFDAEVYGNNDDLVRCLNRVVHQCKSLIAAERCTLFLIDEVNNNLWSVLADGVNERIVVPLSQGIAGCVAQTGEVMRISDVTRENTKHFKLNSVSYETKALLTIPILSGGKVVGVLQAINKEEGDDAFSQEDEDLLVDFAPHISATLIAIKTQVELSRTSADQVSKVKDDMEALRKVHEATHNDFHKHKSAWTKLSRKMSSTMKLEDLFEGIVDHAVTLIGCDRGTLFMIDAETNELWSKAGTSHSLRQEIRLSLGAMGDSIAGDVALTGRPVNVSNAYEDSRFRSTVDTTSGFRTQNVLCCPVFSPGADRHVVAVLEFMNKVPEFNAEDEHTVNEICAQLGGAIQSCYTRIHVSEQAESAASTLHALENELSETRKEVRASIKHRLKLESMLKVTRKLRAENKIGALFEHTMDSVKLLMHADGARLFLIDETTGDLWSQRASDQIHLRRGTGIPGACLASASIVNVPDAQSDPRFEHAVDIMSASTTRSILCAPVFSNSTKKTCSALSRYLTNTHQPTRKSVRLTKTTRTCWKCTAPISGKPSHRASTMHKVRKL